MDLTWQSDLNHIGPRWLLTKDGTHTSQLSIRGAAPIGLCTLTAGTTPGTSNLREFWPINGLTGTDWTATTTLQPRWYGTQPDGINVLPQQGIALRTQQADGYQTGITINNNVYYYAPHCNIGVWRSRLDGTDFRNRQTSIPCGITLGLPYTIDVDLAATVIKVRVYKPDTPPPPWDDPTYAITINLNTQPGADTIPTPTGPGGAALIAAHLGTDPRSQCRWGHTTINPVTTP